MEMVTCMTFSRLLSGEDYQGRLCGLSGEVTLAGASLYDHELLYYSMNVTNVVNSLAGGMFSDSNTTAFDPDAVAADAAELFDPMNLFYDNGNSLISALTANFNGVCLNSCDYNITANSTDTRTWVWPGPTDPDSQTKWDEYVASAATDPSLMEPFTFTALPESVCPYDPEFCVPMQYAPFTSLLDRYCVPKISEYVETAVNTYVPAEFSTAVSVGLGDMVGDIITSWWAILTMAFGGLLISMIFLYILRLCVGVFIWISIWLCFLIMIAGAVTVLLYSSKCSGESIFDTAVAIDTTAEWSSLVEGEKACPSGYSIQSESERTTFQILSYVMFGLSGLYLIGVLIMRKRISLGIAINKVASQFVRQNMSTIFVPLMQCLFLIGWWALWITVLLYTITTVPAGYRDMTGTWPGDYAAATDACAGESGVIIVSYSASGVPLYACREVKWILNWEFWFSIFNLLWMNGFILSIGQTIIAGAVGVWYFTPNHSKGTLGTYPIRTGLRNTFIYHLGTVAFGSLILAMIRFVKFLFFWHVKTAASTTNSKATGPLGKAAGCIAACMYAVLNFIEKVINFLNKNAFIQTALMGTNFCVSCANAVSLIIRNAGRIGTLGLIGGAVHFLGLTFITAGTGLAGWALLAWAFDGKLTSPIGPVIIFIIMGYCIGSVIISVFSISVDSILQCFVSDEEIHKTEGGAKFTPKLLQQFLSSKQAKQEANIQDQPVVGAPRGQVSVVRATA